MSHKYFNRFQHEISTCKTTLHKPAMMIYGPQNIACIIGNLIENVFFIPRWKDQLNTSVVEQKADTRLLSLSRDSQLSGLISALRRREHRVQSTEYPPAVVIVLTGLLKNVLAPASLSLSILCIWRVTGWRPLIVPHSELRASYSGDSSCSRQGAGDAPPAPHLLPGLLFTPSCPN